MGLAGFLVRLVLGAVVGACCDSGGYCCLRGVVCGVFWNFGLWGGIMQFLLPSRLIGGLVDCVWRGFVVFCVWIGWGLGLAGFLV